MDRKLIHNNKSGSLHIPVLKDAHSQTPFGTTNMAAACSLSTYFTRRNKCLVLSVVLCSILILFLANSGLYSSARPVGELCKLSDIEVQEDFDQARFAGSWYGAFTKGMTNSLISKLLEFYDVKIKFTLKEDGNYDIRSVGGKFMGVWCPEGEGRADVASDDSPQKLLVSFDTPTGKKFGTKPAWVLKTDYKSYAVVYSCWEETPSGHCSAPYAIVVSKTPKKLPAKTIQIIHDVISGACMNPKHLKPVVHEGYCKSIRDSYE